MGLDPSNPLTINWSEGDRSRMVVTVSGELDLATAPRMRDALAAILGTSPSEPPLRPRPDVLVVDLSGLELLSAAGLTVLHHAHHLAAEVGVRLRIVTGLRPSGSATPRCCRWPPTN